MEYKNLFIQEEDGIVVLTLNREKALNALNGLTMEELEYAFAHDLPERQNIKGVILKGAGEKAFVAGADIKEFLEKDAASGRAMAKKGHDIYFSIERFSKPVIALVNGFALGGGCELAMACHLRIATESAKFGQPEVNLGIIPGYGGTQRLVQYVGKSKALELMMTGELIDAQEAYRLGLVNYVLPSGEAMEKAKRLINTIAKKAPIAIAKVIEAVNAYYEAGVDGFEVEVNAFGEVTGTDDFKEGAMAFIEKRKPDFKGA